MQGSQVQFQVEDVSPVEKRLKVEVAREHVSTKLEEAYRKLSREVNLRGFRKGKAPRAYLEKLFARQVENDVRQTLVNETMQYIAQNSAVEMLDQPTLEQLSELRRDENLRFSAVFEVMPKVDKVEYDGLEVESRALKITEEQVDKALQDRVKDSVELVPVEGRETIEAADMVTAEATGKVATSTWNAREIQLDLSGDDTLAKAAAPLLVGQPFTVRDVVVNTTLEGQGRFPVPVNLKLSVKAVHTKRLPALDDDFAKDTGEAETLAELRQKIRADLEKAEQETIKQEVRQKLLDALADRNPLQIPAGWTTRAAGRILQDNRPLLFQEMVRQGTDFKEINDGTLRAMAEHVARRQATAQLLLSAVAVDGKIEVTPADVELELAEMAKAQDKSVTRLKAELQRNDPNLAQMRENMHLEKALDLIESRAKIKVSE